MGAGRPRLVSEVDQAGRRRGGGSSPLTVPAGAAHRQARAGMVHSRRRRDGAHTRGAETLRCRIHARLAAR